MSETANPLDILDIHRFVADVLKSIHIGTDAANEALEGLVRYEPGEEVSFEIALSGCRPQGLMGDRRKYFPKAYSRDDTLLSPCCSEPTKIFFTVRQTHERKGGEVKE